MLNTLSATRRSASGPSASQPTEFEIDLLASIRFRYRYFMAYDAERIHAERLLVYRTGKSQRWFDRRFDAATQSEEWAPFSPSFNGPLARCGARPPGPGPYFSPPRPSSISDQLAPLARWMEKCLEIVFPADMLDLNRVASRIQDANFKRRVLKLLHAVDIAVDDLRVGEREPAQKSLEFMHARKGSLPIWLNSIFEAAGTHRLLGLFCGRCSKPSSTASSCSSTSSIPSLHPLVARFLIQLVNDPAMSNRGAQLLLTSHNTSLMDLSFLRRDRNMAGAAEPRSHQPVGTHCCYPVRASTRWLPRTICAGATERCLSFAPQPVRTPNPMPKSRRSNVRLSSNHWYIDFEHHVRRGVEIRTHRGDPGP